MQREPIDWSLEPLGQEPDRVIARRLGVAQQSVHQQRRRRNIPPCPRARTPPVKDPSQSQYERYEMRVAVGLLALVDAMRGEESRASFFKGLVLKEARRRRLTTKADGEPK
jgi:hypothetical protein